MSRFKNMPYVANADGEFAKDPDRARYFNIMIDAPTVAEVRQVLGYDLAPSQGEPFTRLMGDPVLLCNVLYVVCREQCDKLGMTDREFGRSLDGDVIGEATKALTDAMLLFCQPAVRGRYKKMLESMQEADDMLDQLVEEKVGGEKMSELNKQAKVLASEGMDNLIQMSMENLRKKLSLSTGSNTATSAPESSAAESKAEQPAN